MARTTTKGGRVAAKGAIVGGAAAKAPTVGAETVKFVSMDNLLFLSSSCSDLLQVASSTQISVHTIFSG